MSVLGIATLYVCHCKNNNEYFTYFRITLHNKGDNYCEVIKHCIKSKTRMQNVIATEIPTINTTNITIDNETVELNESSGSGMIPVTPEATEIITPATDQQPTKKPTEKRSTDIIDILIGSRRRRANRSKKVSR